MKDVDVENRGEICRIEWADPKKIRSRKVVKRSNARVTYKYPGLKAGRMMQAESALERDNLRLHDVDPFVGSATEQPARLVFWMEGVLREHYPDLFVETPVGGIFREVKSDDEMEDPYIKRRAQYLADVMPMIGYRYELIGEAEIRREPRLSNATFLLKFGRNPVDSIDQERIRRIISDAGIITWGEILSGYLGDKGVHMACRLIIEGILAIDIEAVWSHNTPVKMAGGR